MCVKCPRNRGGITLRTNRRPYISSYPRVRPLNGHHVAEGTRQREEVTTKPRWGRKTDIRRARNGRKRTKQTQLSWHCSNVSASSPPGEFLCASTLLCQWSLMPKRRDNLTMSFFAVRPLSSLLRVFCASERPADQMTSFKFAFVYPIYFKPF